MMVGNIGGTQKKQASYSTMRTEAMMFSCVMDAMEGRGVAMINIPEAFLHADMDDIVNMIIYEAM